MAAKEKEKKKKMATLTHQRTDRAIIIIWSGSGMVRNLTGLTHDHVTAVTKGTVEFRFKERTLILKAGEEINLPLNVPYDVVSLEDDNEVRCFYPHGPVADGIKHLVRDEPMVFPDFDKRLLRERSETVQDIRNPASGIRQTTREAGTGTTTTR